jgi:small-conductance mechanosensitive channel
MPRATRTTYLRLTSALAMVALPASASAQDGSQAAKFIEFFRVEGVLPALMFIAIAVVLLRFITSVATRFGERFTERRLLAQQVSTILRFAIYIVLFVLVIRSLFRLERETMLALAGTLAVAVGFALKDLTASVVAGIMILFDRPFQVGDRVTFGEYYGEIRSIGLRSVRMVTLDDSVVTIPNNKFLTDVVVSGNTGALDMQVVIDFFIAQDADLMRAKRIVQEALRTSRFVYLSKPVVVLVNEVVHQTYLATRLRAKAYVLDVRYEKAFESDVTERVKDGFASAQIAPPVRREQQATPLVVAAPPAAE